MPARPYAWKPVVALPEAEEPQLNFPGDIKVLAVDMDVNPLATVSLVRRCKLAR